MTKKPRKKFDFHYIKNQQKINQKMEKEDCFFDFEYLESFL